ncbi:copper amine oxidase N-terminal domain-containing protein [Paenibacillus sp. GCM10023252]|uniref:copper amine oxidase N-terminal domain-containing protein n=1 Tax=Paenibacillus sp. GCM10023252 TaxID=3252649 RepID=UPI0036070BAD
MKKRKAIRYVQALSLAAILSTTAIVPGTTTPEAGAAASVVPSSKEIKITYNGYAFIPETAPFNVNGTVYLPVRDVSVLLGARVTWNNQLRRVTIQYPEKLITLVPGATEATMNGKKSKLTAPVLIKQGRTYIPLRFLSEALGANIAWNGTTRTVSITQTNLYATSESAAYPTLWLSRTSGALYTVNDAVQIPVKFGNLTAKQQGNIELKADQLDSGGMVVTITDNYGEPSIHNTVYTLFVSNSRIVKQAKAQYFQRYEQGLTSYLGQPLLNDGKTLLLLDDKGMTQKEYDLTKLGGYDENYAVLGMGEWYMVIRPNQTGLLTLIDLESNEAIPLHKEFLSELEQDYSETNEVPYKGDNFTFRGETPDGKLKFEYRSMLNSKTYDYLYTR